MASSEGIPSAFPTQPSARSPKLRFYESLFLWNQGVDHVVALLRGMEKFPSADKESLQFGQAEIEGVRCSVNADFVEYLADSERFDEGRFGKQKRAFEKKWRDPDDVYVDVERREGERQKQESPARVGVVRQSAVAEEERRRDARQVRKKKSARRPKRPTGGRS